MDGIFKASVIIWGAFFKNNYYYCRSKWAPLSLAEFSEGSTIFWGVLLKRKYIWHLVLTVQNFGINHYTCSGKVYWKDIGVV
ncbi:hypothetical protein SUGI_0604830 [Cryptomeria japonica]|nr:hypothetical protein SUGI_0604830 [Cryptomeria japonica]